MIVSLALRYLIVFAVVLAGLSIGAYELLAREYAALLQPALGTPEASSAYAAAMRRVVETIAALDLPLLVMFGAAAWFMAAASLHPLLEAKERERAFAADAAHALRSPLATIASIAQARRGEAAGDDADAYATIARSALEASGIVGDLLTLARSAHERGLLKEPIDLAAVVRDVMREFREEAAARNVRLEPQVQSLVVDADERRVRELARNLLSNAVRHARSAVRVCLRPDGAFAQLLVTNDGEPIGADAERVFERFYRADGGSGGTGLGLAIVRWIASAHGGTAIARDCPRGEGAEFLVCLPLLRS